MAANRAEIAVRIMRAATELNMETVGIYGAPSACPAPGLYRVGRLSGLLGQTRQ